MKKILLTFTIILISLTNSISAESIPSFTLTTIDDKNITVSETKEGLDFHELKGKAILLSFFGLKCPPCLKEMPEFISLKNKYKDNLEIIALEAQLYPVDKIKAFVAEHKINYKVIAGVEHKDFISYLAERAKYDRGIPLPLLFAINKDGDVESVQAGLIPEDQLEDLIKDLND